MKKNTAIISIIAVAILGFLGGFEYGKAHAPAPLASMRRGMGMTGAYAGRGAMGAAGGFTTGTVVAKDDKSITIAMQGSTGGSKIIFVDSTTQVMKTDAGTLADVTQGDTVIVTGTPNSDGSLNAKSIQIRPAMPAGTTAGQMQNGTTTQ